MEKGKANDSVMLDVGARLESFKRVQWPFKDDCFCTPEKMAEAGFYACGGENEPDLVRCYFCRKVKIYFPVENIFHKCINIH